MARLCASLIVGLMCVVTVPYTHAQLYWDTDTSSGAAANSGTWDSLTPNWATDATGTTNQAWTPDAIAQFSAAGGNNYTVNLATSESASGITFGDNGVIISSGSGAQLTLTGTTPTVSFPSATNAIADRVSVPILGTSGLNITSGTGGGTLELTATNGYSGPTSVGSGATLDLGAAGAAPTTSAYTLGASSKLQLSYTSLIDASAVGFDQTVRSVAGAGSISLGLQTLTIADQPGDNNTLTGLYTSAAGSLAGTHARIIYNGQGQLTLNNFPTGAGYAVGEFIVNSGTIGIGQNNVFGSAGCKLTINPNNLATGPTFKRTGATINLGVGNIDIGGNFTYDHNGTNDTQLNGNNGASTTTLKADNPVITVLNGSRSGGTFIFAGDIVDDGNIRGFTKAGPGTMTLGSKGNSYRGETTIQEGYLRVRAQTNSANIGVARIGDGTGRINLSGGQLEYNGSVVTAGDPRTFTVTNPVRVTANSSIGYFTSTATFTDAVTFDFTSNDISATLGSLSLNRTTASTNTNQFRPTFSGTGFTFGQPVSVTSESATRITQFNSANSTGTQTWSGVISGNGSYRRSNAGATLFTAANTYSGGTIVDGGTLTVSGSTATFGGGDVTVNAGNAAISAGVANAILDTASLTLLGGGAANLADTGFINLAAGINEVVGSLVLGSTAQANGTYGSTLSTATFKNNEYFSGTGILTVGPVGLAGDYNGDGKVDAADYVMWRKNPGAFGGDPAGYTTWRQNFGLPGAGSGLSGGGAVPEPGIVSLLVFAIGSVVLHRRAKN